MPTPERTIHVDFGPRSYDVVIGSGLLVRAGERIRAALQHPARRCHLFVDSCFAFYRHGEIHRESEMAAALRQSIEACGISATGRSFLDGESSKGLAEIRNLVEEMAIAGLDRRDLVVTFGGGATGDVGGFAAAIYKRGIAYVQIPTTLLAMVDASVGGKTGVNLRVFDNIEDVNSYRTLKNYVGAFHQPRLVLADVDTLHSLPARELSAGLAECIKHAMLGVDLGDPDLLSWMLARRDAIMARETDVLVELIARNVAIKAKVVSADEFEIAPDEVGGRALLNLGHTFGHAIETLPAGTPGVDDYEPKFLHGEAVALGLCAAAACSQLAGLSQVGIVPQVRAAVEAFGLPTNVGGLPQSTEIIERMRADKKTIGGSLRLILPTRIGSARVVRDVPEGTIARAIDAIRSMGS